MPAPAWRLVLPHGRDLLLGGIPRVMGVLNLTPDSFSDGGRWDDPDRAVERGLQMLAEGADLLDLGAESTRPGGGVYGAGAPAVPAADELARLLPVLDALRTRTSAPLSVDTRKAAVAREALAAGADLVNDVSALADPAMAGVVAEAGCPVVLMHSRGDLGSMQRNIHFTDVVREVRAELAERAGVAAATGIGRGQILVDPGIGFGKTADQNLALLRGTAELAALGLPLLVGASRKSFIGHVAGAAVADRLAGSLAAAGWAARGGAAIVRVHDVKETVQFLEVWDAIGRARAPVTVGGPPGA